MPLGYIGGKEVLLISPSNRHLFVEYLRDCLQQKQAEGLWTLKKEHYHCRWVGGRWLDQEGGALTNGIRALIQEAPQSSLAPLHFVREQEVCSLQPGRLSLEPAMLLPLSWTFSFQTVRNKFHFKNKPPSLW